MTFSKKALGLRWKAFENLGEIKSSARQVKSRGGLKKGGMLWKFYNLLPKHSTPIGSMEL